jgi:RecA-family ATPase
MPENKKPAPKPPSIPAYSVVWLMEQKFPDVDFTVEGILPEGLSILAGPPKIGKSWMALSVGLAIASGSDALGIFPVNQGEVLIAALEDNERRMKQRIETLLAADQKPPQGLYIAHQLPPISSKLTETVESWLAEHPDTRLIVIDTLARIRRATSGGNAYQKDADAIGQLQRLAAKHHISLMLVHHLRKSNPSLDMGDDIFEEVSGTTGITGSADCIFVLQRKRTQADAELSITGRDIEEQELALKFENGLWTVSGDASTYRSSPERVAILELLQERGPMAPKAVADALKKNHQTIKNLMWKMADKGDLRKVEGGRYDRADTLTLPL